VLLMGRGAPRWSVAGQVLFVPLSMAGLPGSKAWVKLGPPLSAKSLTLGSVLGRSEGWSKPQLSIFSTL
jgi:hypothetical protein